MSDYSLLLILAKEEVTQGVEDSIYDLPKKGKGDLLNIEGDNVAE